jgi:hypothetical protein
MFVVVRWEGEGLAVPLSQLEVIRDADDETQEAVEDWLYNGARRATGSESWKKFSGANNIAYSWDLRNSRCVLAPR